MDGQDPSELLGALDWSATPLGPRAGWPRSLETLIALLMRSKRPQYVVWGPERRFFYNAAFLPVMGIKHPDGFGQPMAGIWPEVWQEIEPLVSSCIDKGVSHFFEDRPFVLRRHGRDELTYFSFSYTPVQDDDGALSGLLCVLEERTRGIELEAQRRAEMQRMQQLFQQAPGFMCVSHGTEHRIALVNDAYESLVGQPRDALIGKRVADALPEVVEQGFITLLDHVYAYGEPYVGRDMPVRLHRHPGGLPEERFVDFLYQPITDGDGAITGIFIQGSDVTARVRAESELRASEQALRNANAHKDQFLAVLGHELRNPLAPIHTATEILDLLVGQDPRAKQCVDIIARQARHMVSLVEDLVDVARITNDLIALDRKAFELNAIVQAAVEQVGSHAAERRHSVRVQCAPIPVWVDVDERRMTQVFTNLLSNAIRYTPRGGEIRVAVAAENGTARVEVEDNGDGIAADLLPDLFVPFVQAKRSTDRVHGGLGIGLSLVDRLVDAHGGRVDVVSEGLGKGSRFTVRLPLVGAG